MARPSPPANLVSALWPGSRPYIINTDWHGESHLLDTLKSQAHLPVSPLLQAVVAAVQQFSSGSEQQDDITLVIVRSLA